MKLSQSRSVESPSPNLAVIAPYVKGEDSRLLDLSGDTEGLTAAQERGELKGSLYKVAQFRGTPNLFAVGAGKEADLDSVRYFRAVAAGARAASRAGFTHIAVCAASVLDVPIVARASIEGAVWGIYDEGLLKTAEHEVHELEELVYVGPEVTDQELQRSLVVAESVNFARGLVDLPPGDLTPRIFAQKLAEMSRESGIECHVLDEDQIRTLGMGAILGVAKGSDEPPRVIDMRYGDPEAPVKLALVGKGLTFDSGGLSLKTADGMVWMKGDMGGSAAVAGAMRAIGLLKPSGVHVRGIIASVENMPGPSAMKPGDVLRTMSGKTIEVLNTDAEGRLVLSDALALAVQGGATNIVDLATLTGAVMVALGHEAAGLIGRPKAWTDQVLQASQGAMERLWPLPLYPEYRTRMDSSIADMKNSGGRAGGALTASAMLSEFVGDVPWAHLDIAGTAWEETKTAYAGPGGSGFGVATLVQLAFNLGGRS